MTSKEKNLALNLGTGICLACMLLTMWHFQTETDEKETDGTKYALADMAETSETESVLPRFCYLWTDEEKTVYYEDTETTYVHRASALGNIEDEPLTNADGEFLTYDMWRKIHPDWHY